MELLNHTQFEVRQWISLDPRGQKQGNLLIKGAFLISSDGHKGFQLAADATAIAIHAQDQFFGEPNNSSVRAESDFNAMKPSTDITANATAFAPEGKAKLSWLAGIQLEAAEPVMVRVYGPRHWHQSALVPMISLSQPCTAVPLRFENAFGGCYQDKEQLQGSPYNPVGCGLRAAARFNKDNRVHQIEWPDQLIHEVNARHPQPAAGFGVRHRSWQPRLALAGSYDAQWLQSHRHQYPADYQATHHFAGCEPLRPKHYLQGGEKLTFYHLSPQHSEASIRLPVYKFFWQLQGADGRTIGAPCVLESIHLEIEQGLEQGYVMISWRSHWPIAEGACQLKVIQLDAATC